MNARQHRPRKGHALPCPSRAASHLQEAADDVPQHSHTGLAWVDALATSSPGGNQLSRCRAPGGGEDSSFSIVICKFGVKDEMPLCQTRPPSRTIRTFEPTRAAVSKVLLPHRASASRCRVRAAVHKSTKPSEILPITRSMVDRRGETQWGRLVWQLARLNQLKTDGYQTDCGSKQELDGWAGLHGKGDRRHGG